MHDDDLTDRSITRETVLFNSWNVHVAPVGFHNSVFFSLCNLPFSSFVKCINDEP